MGGAVLVGRSLFLSPMHPIELRNKIRSIVEPTVTRLGFDLVAVEILGDHRGRMLRLSIEGEAGVRAKDCAEVSRELSPVLDASDPIEGRYNLEVSSPGIERPVQRLDDFRRFKGYRVRIRLTEGHPRRRYSGRLGPVDGEERIVVQADDGEHSLFLDDIEHAHLVLDLDEYQGLFQAREQSPGELP